MANPKQNLKNLLGDIPLAVEMYWTLSAQHKPWSSHFNLEYLKGILPGAVEAVQNSLERVVTGKKVFVFATLHYWIQHAALTALGLAGLGHQVSFGYLPYSDWDKQIDQFDLKKQNLYARQVLNQAARVMEILPVMSLPPIDIKDYPKLHDIVEQTAIFDTQYTLQVETIDKSEPLYQFRYQRNLQAALALTGYLEKNRPDVVVIPNGTIQELGVCYRVASMLGIDTVTYEFSDQLDRIWMAQNYEIMRHNTDDLWQGLGHIEMDSHRREMLLKLVSARKNAKLWGRLTRLWQTTPSQGAQALRDALHLDERPVVLLATNVLGDSLTLDRQVFSENMADWIIGTLKYFLNRDDVQLVIRVHPGEMLIHGMSMVEVINSVSPNLPDHIHVVRPDEKINTYDIIELVDLGLVFTTTVGLEMAMAGIPVVVAGQTHYKKRGFTYDPENWQAYFSYLDKILANPEGYHLSEAQIELAWRYAYLFFFEFPLPFPWHILHLEKTYTEKPMADVLSAEGQKKYGQTFAYLSGKKLDWSARGLQVNQVEPD